MGEKKNIHLEASYIKSKKNVIADYLSRLDNPDTELALSQEAFSIITRNFGKPEIDLFASFSNRKCDGYISRFPEVQAFEIDAFTIP